jgi:hypothetical protein
MIRVQSSSVAIIRAVKRRWCVDKICDDSSLRQHLNKRQQLHAGKCKQVAWTPTEAPTIRRRQRKLELPKALNAKNVIQQL